MKWLVYITLFCVVSACGVSRKSLKNRDRQTGSTSPVAQISQEQLDSAQQLLQQVRQVSVPFETFSAKVKIQYEDAYGKQPGSVATVRMVRDSVIWVSVQSALIGLEAYRLLLTPDSLLILDKLNKTFERRPFESFQQLSNLPLGFNDLQAYLAGEPVFLDGELTGYNSTSEGWVLQLSDDGVNHMVDVNSSRQITRSILTEVHNWKPWSITLYYGDYQPQASHFLPLYREIYVADESKAHAVLTYSQIEFNKELSLPFQVPDNYTIK